MILHELILSNWQPFYGSGLNGQTKISMLGKNNEHNVLIYGQNTHGKSAIWQAIQFAMYGKVNKRKTGWEDGKYKPLLAFNTGEEPLLNLKAFENDEFHAEVKLKYTHGKDDHIFELSRTITLKSGRKTAQSPSDVEWSLVIRNLSTGEFVPDKKSHLDSILPEQIAQFFMFDGERLNSYRDLFEDTKSVKLKQYIEDVLQLPILTQGIDDFKALKKRNNKDLSGILVDKNKNKELAEEIAEKTSTLQDIQENIDEYEDRISKIESEISQIEIWLKDNDDSKEAYDEISGLEGKIKGYEEQLPSAEDDISDAMPETWRNIISQKLQVKIDELDEQLETQREHHQSIGQKKSRIEHLNNTLEEKDCNSCGQKLQKLNTKQRDNVVKEISDLEQELEDLNLAAITPDPFTLQTERNKLGSIMSDKSLSNAVRQHQKLQSLKNKITRNLKLLEKARKKLTDSKFKEVQKKGRDLKKKEGDLHTKNAHLEREMKDFANVEGEIETLTGRISDYVESKEAKQFSKIDTLLDRLIDAWEKEKAPYRESKRKEVEENATKTFKNISTIASDFKKIQIESDFSVDLINNHGKPDGGSSGQSALIAYSVIDALSQSSEIEFPFMIDTPSVSIDNDNLEMLFDYLLDPKYSRQVIIFPEGKEMNPDEGDSKYGPNCAATYELERVENYHSKIKTRINNT